jgi:hypothetical protein
VKHYFNFLGGLRALAFTVDVESAIEQAAAFNQAGIPSAAVSGKTDPRERQDAIRKIKRGDLKVLVNCDLFGEGTDLPEVEAVIFERPTESFGLFVQQFCRPLTVRPGKSHGIIVDAVRNVRIQVNGNTVGRHPLPDSQMVWSLDNQTKRSKGSETFVTQLRTCSNCAAAYDKTIYGMFCPYCATQYNPPQRSAPAHVDGDLFELSPEALAELRGQLEAVERAPKIPHGADKIIVNSIQKRHREKLEAVTELRQSIALWAAGKQDIPRAQREFYASFGVDVWTAQTLKTAEIKQLIEKVRS